MKDQRRHILFFLSEWLGIVNLLPVVRTLQGEAGVDVAVINDGFGAQELDKAALAYCAVGEPFGDSLPRWLDWADMVVSSKSYRQPAEECLIRMCQERKLPLAMMIADMGGEIGSAKFASLTDSGSRLLPSYILISDPIAHEGMLSAGFPAQLFVPVGSPWFDHILECGRQRPAPPVKRTITYFDGPFELDFQRGVLPAGPYSQIQFVEELVAAVLECPMPLVFRAKCHVQSNDACMARLLALGAQCFDSVSSVELIQHSSLVIGAYSTTLLESWLLGVPSISFQPWECTIREDVFRSRVSVAKDRAQLSSLLWTHLQRGTSPGRRAGLTYHPGSAAEHIVEFILRTGRHTDTGVTIGCIPEGDRGSAV